MNSPIHLRSILAYSNQRYIDFQFVNNQKPEINHTKSRYQGVLQVVKISRAGYLDSEKNGWFRVFFPH
jgi:hypothetical protein